MLKHYPKDQQAKGSFNFGKILENKPIGFPQDGGALKPYSTLFYWAHAWSDSGGLIDEHPHKGFEIMSYVLKGEIEHYDNRMKGWKKLKAGDAQIIRAGNGIVHAEKLNEGSAIFQIWFDPDLSKSLSQPASYSDYPAEAFPVSESRGMKIKQIKGKGSPFEMSSKIDFIQEITLSAGTGVIDLEPRYFYSVYCIEGSLNLNGTQIEAHDFVQISGEDSLKTEVADSARLFVIKSPASPGFKTYFDAMTGS
jgi:quercetin 2,3-dioxygenase